MTGFIMLAGGGNERDSAPLDRRFAEQVGLHGRMLYLPVALAPQSRSYELAYRWLATIFQPLGIAQIEMWTDLSKHQPTELQGFNAVYIGGGNTYRLAQLVRANGFDLGLIDYFRSGGAIYGGSAGAILLGSHLDTCAHLDRNEIGLQDLNGLDLVSGAALWCHYSLWDEGLIATYRQQNSTPLVVLSERAGLFCHEGGWLAAGFESVHLFNVNGRRAFSPGERLPL